MTSSGMEDDGGSAGVNSAGGLSLNATGSSKCNRSVHDLRSPRGMKFPWIECADTCRRLDNTKVHEAHEGHEVYFSCPSCAFVASCRQRVQVFLSRRGEGEAAARQRQPPLHPFSCCLETSRCPPKRLLARGRERVVGRRDCQPVRARYPRQQ